MLNPGNADAYALEVQFSLHILLGAKSLNQTQNLPIQIFSLLDFSGDTFKAGNTDELPHPLSIGMGPGNPNPGPLACLFYH